MGSTEEEDAFFEDVESRIRDGWVCQGGVSSSAADGDIANLFQAMVKETEMRASEYHKKHGRSPGNGGARKTRRRNGNRNRSRRN